MEPWNRGSIRTLGLSVQVQLCRMLVALFVKLADLNPLTDHDGCTFSIATGNLLAVS